jgi:hypothetical protein
LLLEKGADIRAKNAEGESVAEEMMLPKKSKELIQKAVKKEEKQLKMVMFVCLFVFESILI